MDEVQTFLSICLGIGLSAACGFRVFVPLLCLSAGSMAGYVQLHDSYEWVGTMPALIAFSVATALEIAAYYIPYLDNLLDSVAVPLAGVAGALVSGFTMGEVDPFLRWTIALIAGGGAATSTQIATTKLRAVSSATTGGVGNPVLATAEAGAASVLSVTAILWPVVAFILAIAAIALCWIAVYFVGKRLVRLFRQKAQPPVVSATP